jgi:hypothetical protein
MTGSKASAVLGCVPLVRTSFSTWSSPLRLPHVSSDDGGDSGGTRNHFDM